VPGTGGVGPVDADLGVVDLAGGPGVLALHPDRAGALLEVAGLVNHQHGRRVAEVLDHVRAQVTADAVVVPHRPGQQVLHPVRAGVANVLSDPPAVLPGQVGQQSQHQRPGPPSGLHPGKPARDPAQQLLEPCLPPGSRYLYAVAGGHRLIFGYPHNTRSSTVAALGRPKLPPDQADNDLRLEY
jgi:hypothetical protein